MSSPLPSDPNPSWNGYSTGKWDRERATAKRGGGIPRVNLDEIADVSSGRGNELIALDEALESLAKLDPRKAGVIELRFFGGLSVEETAAVLKDNVDWEHRVHFFAVSAQIRRALPGGWRFRRPNYGNLEIVTSSAWRQDTVMWDWRLAA